MTCEECDGTGRVEYQVGDQRERMVECNVCEGHGHVLEEQDEYEARLKREGLL